MGARTARRAAHARHPHLRLDAAHHKNRLPHARATTADKLQASLARLAAIGRGHRRVAGVIVGVVRLVLTRRDPAQAELPGSGRDPLPGAARHQPPGRPQVLREERGQMWPRIARRTHAGDRPQVLREERGQMWPRIARNAGRRRSSPRPPPSRALRPPQQNPDHAASAPTQTRGVPIPAQIRRVATDAGARAMRIAR